jgi:hypothetical protein
MRSLLDFRAHFSRSGARPNLFRIILKFPPLAGGGDADELISFQAESSSLPADKLGEIEVPYMGRKTYYPGDREFDPWTITVQCDEDFKVRNAFERWMSALNEHVANIRDNSAASPYDYSADPVIQQLSKLDEPPVKQYRMVGAFPTELGAIETDWGTNNTIAKFQTTLRYQWWESVGLDGMTTDGQGVPLIG